MMNIGAEFPFAKSELGQSKMKMIELPYVGDRIVMQILIPHENNKQGMSNSDSLLSTIKKEIADVGSLFNKNQRKTSVKVKLPKFNITYSRNLNKDLEHLGMKNMFIERVADFSRIDGTRDLFVSFVKQDVAIEVNEEGSEAAAATAVVLDLTESASFTFSESFIVDQPFLFFIRDKQTEMMLFLGKIVDPS